MNVFEADVLNPILTREEWLATRGNGGPVGRTHRERSVPIKGCLLEGRVVTYNAGRNKAKRAKREAARSVR